MDFDISCEDAGFCKGCNYLSCRCQSRERAVSRDRTVICLKCGNPIPYQQGTCPHCGYVEFK